MDRRPLWHGPAGPRDRRGLRIQPGFQGCIIHIRWQGPGHSRRRRPPQDLGHGTARHPTTLGDLPVAELARLVESHYVVDRSHRHSLRWHRLLLPLRWRGHDTEDCGGRASRFARNRIRRVAAPHAEGCRPPIPRTRRIVAGFPSESVAGFRRNGWPGWVGIRTNSLISRDNSGMPNAGNQNSIAPSISSDGRYVAFTSLATNLATSVSGQQIYLHDRNGPTTSHVSIDNSVVPVPGNAASDTPSISGNGGFVAFASRASTLLAGGVGPRRISMSEHYPSRRASSGGVVRSRAMPLSRCHPLIAEWFHLQVGQPTDVQVQDWPAIQSGADVLIAAQTGHTNKE